MPEEWLESLKLHATEWRPYHGMGLRRVLRRVAVAQGSATEREPPAAGLAQAQKTPSVDGMVTSLVKNFGLHSLQQLLHLLRSPLRDWPPCKEMILYASSTIELSVIMRTQPPLSGLCSSLCI